MKKLQIQLNYEEKMVLQAFFYKRAYLFEQLNKVEKEMADYIKTLSGKYGFEDIEIADIENGIVNITIKDEDDKATSEGTG